MRKTITRAIVSATLLASSSLYIGTALAGTTQPPQAGDYSPDGQWVKMHGPEGDWAPAPHRYDFRNGKLSHSDSLDHQQRTASADNKSFTPNRRDFTPRQFGPID